MTIENLLKEMKISKKIMELKHPLFTMKINEEGNELSFITNDDVRRQLYSEDVIIKEHKEKNELSFLDLVYSTETSNPYAACARVVKNLDFNNYDKNDVEDAASLICIYALAFNEYILCQIKDLKSIDKAIPTQIFCKIVNGLDKKLEVKAIENDEIYAGTLENISINKSIFGMSIHFSLKIISKGQIGYIKGNKFFSTGFKPSIKSLNEIGIYELTAEEKAQLTERGAKYIKYTKKSTYCQCKGFGYSYGSFGDIRSSINSRIMIDADSMRLLNSWIDDDWYYGQIFDEYHPQGEEQKTIDTEELWMCSPVIYGFAFGNKQWYRMKINDISDIVFSKTAFDELIVPEAYKNIFVASLTNNMPSLDSIENKGQGKIFLLYGAPGVGKTLTAESVAEYLRKPIYFVSVGELGIKPQELEESLKNIMEIASKWDAVMLLDEVDVFAVDRKGASIERNAMTAIFLRMLERYSGILFMTTNLKDNLDPAFISRSTATIHYESLKVEDRIKIWNSILNKAEKLGEIKISEDIYNAVPKFAETDLNGRVIKNAIRLAYSLALNREDKTLNHDDLNSVLNIGA